MVGRVVEVGTWVSDTLEERRGSIQRSKVGGSTLGEQVEVRERVENLHTRRFKGVRARGVLDRGCEGNLGDIVR